MAMLRQATHRDSARTGAGTFAAASLLFGSGFAGLVYQVLWMRELGFLFGNGSYAVATTLAAFFLGIAAGSAAFGGLAARSRRPLLAYSALEAGVAVTALLYFGLLDLFGALYEPLFAALGDSPLAFIAAKFSLAVAVLFPPAFFMGGTLPMMSQHRVRHAQALGTTATLLYAVNTLGAAAGAFATPFLLVRSLGVRGAYTAAILITLCVAVIAALLGRRERSSPTAAAAAPAGVAVRAGTARGLRWLAWLSGFATVALEVLWTRMFAQVVHNSVYTFATILVTFLLALAAGAGAARALARRAPRTDRTLPILLLGGALLVAATPFVFNAYTSGLEGLGSQSGFAGYVLRVFGAALCVLGLPVVWLGLLFPYLLKAAEGWHASPGRIVGELAALNTFGGVAGSLAAGFVLLEWLGLWLSIASLALVYLISALGFAIRPFGVKSTATASLLAAGLCLAVANYAADLPHLSAGTGDEKVIEIFEGSGATVAVIKGGRGLRLKHNNNYGLGGSGDRNQEARQAHWPLLLHAAPQRAFFLGMGTGITAGAALQHPLDRLLVTELEREVVTASDKYFDRYTNGLFGDERAQVRIEDGRNVLRGSRDEYDVIVADLFLPWKAGVGGLYSREHYAAAKARLATGGLYGQWLLLTQFSEEEFAAVARTMLEVFPRVTLWRANERTAHPLVLLLGERDPESFSAEAIDRRIAEVTRTGFDKARVRPEHRAIPDDATRMLLGYGGNLSAARELFAQAPINSDDRPFVEYSAPVTHREKRGGTATSFRGEPLIAFLDTVFDAAAPESDPALASLPEAWRTLPRAGLELYRSRVLKWSGKPDEAAAAAARHESLLDRAQRQP